jgi:uncharacterized BrkB/YihY/UPF0761 family membrane protein
MAAASHPSQGEDSFGDFQAAVGRTGARVHVFFAYIGLFVAIVLGVIIGVVGQEGQLYRSEVDDGNNQKIPLPRWSGWVIGAVIIAIGVIFLLIMRQVSHFEDSNKSFAELGGTMTELGILNSMRQGAPF